MSFYESIEGFHFEPSLERLEGKNAQKQLSKWGPLLYDTTKR